MWIRLPNWLGDALLARPLLAALARAYGSAAIRAAAPEALLSVLGGDRTFGASDAWPAHSGERSRTLGHVRSWRPEAALVLPPSFSSALDAWRTGARVRIGYAGEARSPLLTRALRRPARGARHLSEEYLALGAALGNPNFDGAAPP
ncbi:MAG: glycosyltransferase family 9 protein, partial [Candidatus Eiseniibacteriota bacterium]